MNKPILNLISAIILSAAIVFSVWYYVEFTRFQIVNSQKGIAYRLDKTSGKVSIVLPNGEIRYTFESAKNPLLGVDLEYGKKPKIPKGFELEKKPN